MTCNNMDLMRALARLEVQAISNRSPPSAVVMNCSLLTTTARGWVAAVFVLPFSLENRHLADRPISRYKYLLPTFQTFMSK